MTKPKRDLLSTLVTLGDQKRSGRLRLNGETWAASITFNGGLVSRVALEPNEGWRLGELLRYVRVLSPQRFRRASRVARKRGAGVAEALAIRKGWVAEPVYRRFQERLAVERVIELAAKSGYRAVFSAREGEAQPSPTDVAIPVHFIEKTISERSRDMMQEDFPLPRGDAYFGKTGESISYILGGSGNDLPEGAPLMGLTAHDRRAFFFCNGEIPFCDLSLVMGVTPQQLAGSIRNLVKINAVYQAEGKSRWAVWAKNVQTASRPLLAFVGGVVTVAVVLGLVGATLIAMDERRGGVSFEGQMYFRSGEGDARRILSDALYTYFLNRGSYPESLAELEDGGHVSSEWFRRQVLPREVGYERDADERGCRLVLGAEDLSYRHGGPSKEKRVKKE